ncbi:MAG: SBBP repeat-containing protein [Acidobacteria bacterium]|nr:SBBP repeat-containing protein [Acidobacteriota bacterium]
MGLGIETVSDRSASANQAALRMKLAGANPQSEVVGGNELPGKVNYFIGNDPARWHTLIPTYARVQYREVYPGIDLVYHGDQGQLEYEFMVAPGADPSRIALEFRGAKGLAIDARGDLVLQMADGREFRQRRPVIYQEAVGRRMEVEGAFQITNSGSSVGFRIAGYDSTRPLVSDPVLVYSTYFGGIGNETEWRAIAADAAGNAYVAGTTASVNFPVANAIQSELRGTQDAFVAKLNPAGSTLIYCTYLGGSAAEIGYAIAVDMSGNAYVTGLTGSTDFPLANALQSVYGGSGPGNNGGASDDAFVAKIAP